LSDFDIQWIVLLLQYLGPYKPHIVFVGLSYLTGHYAWESVFTLRMRKKLSRQLSYLFSGFGVTSPAVNALALLGAMSVDFNRNESLILVGLCAAVPMVYFFKDYDDKELLTVKYRRLVKTFWGFSLFLVLMVGGIWAIAYKVYPPYLSPIATWALYGVWNFLLPFWFLAALHLLAHLFVPRHWLNTPSPPLVMPFRKRQPENFHVSIFLRHYKNEMKRILVPLFFILFLVFADTVFPLFTPKIVMGQIRQDTYYSHFQDGYPYDYVLMLNLTDPKTPAIEEVYELRNLTVVMTPALLSFDRCVIYENPAPPGYVLDQRGPSALYEPTFFRIRTISSNNKALGSWPNDTFTEKIVQCTPESTHFYFLNRVQLPIETDDRCFYSSSNYTRRDFVTIQNSKHYRILLAFIVVEYNGKPPASAYLAINGQNVTLGTNVQGYGQEAIITPLKYLQNPFSSSAYSIELFYNSTLGSPCKY
jgi:hypothetical protein